MGLMSPSPSSSSRLLWTVWLQYTSVCLLSADFVLLILAAHVLSPAGPLRVLVFRPLSLPLLVLDTEGNRFVDRTERDV
jgi:hypothetical protein